jgi:hypothetical protein
MNRNATIAPLVSAYDVEVNAGELDALLAEARWEIRRQHAAEAVHRLKIRRHSVAAVVQRLVGDVEFSDLVEELTVA